jgi:hypothetical protein
MPNSRAAINLPEQKQDASFSEYPGTAPRRPDSSSNGTSSRVPTSRTCNSGPSSSGRSDATTNVGKSFLWQRVLYPFSSFTIGDLHLVGSRTPIRSHMPATRRESVWSEMSRKGTCEIDKPWVLSDYWSHLS